MTDERDGRERWPAHTDMTMAGQRLRHIPHGPYGHASKENPKVHPPEFRLPDDLAFRLMFGLIAAAGAVAVYVIGRYIVGPGSWEGH